MHGSRIGSSLGTTSAALIALSTRFTLTAARLILALSSHQLGHGCDIVAQVELDFLNVAALARAA